MLLLDAGRIVTVERLIDGLYGEKPPAGVANALRSQVSRLWAALGVPVENHLAGYRLVAERDDIDVHRFERLAARGRDTLAAAGLLRDALALWRGPVLADVGDAPFARPQMVRLEELRGVVTEDRIEAGLRLGGYRELVGELRELVAMHPLRERLRAQLMRALYGSGRQSEALEVYEEARGSLAGELGVDPGPELAAAHLAVLRGEAGSAAVVGSRETGPSAVSRETAPSRDSRETAAAPQGLPAQLSSFVGRAEELARIGGLLGGGARLVTLDGPGGVGRTRLAVEAAGQYEGEVCFVDLSAVDSAVDDGEEVSLALLGALGMATPDREELTAHLAAARAAFDELFAAPRRYPRPCRALGTLRGSPRRRTRPGAGVPGSGRGRRRVDNRHRPVRGGQRTVCGRSAARHTLPAALFTLRGVPAEIPGPDEHDPAAEGPAAEGPAVPAPLER
jgi:DNA-binding SARP family transcriptional activator